MSIRTHKYGKTETILLGLVTAVTVALLLQLYADGINGNDFWWHVKVGEWIIDNHRVPTSGIFSWYATEQGFGWVAHEWLAEVIFYGIFHWFGEIGVWAFSALLAIGTALLMIWFAKDHIVRSPMISVVFFAMFTVIAHLIFLGRPHVFAYIFVLLELACLYRFYNNPQSRSIYWIPVMTAFWSNLHGGSSNLSYILCGVFLIAGMISVDGKHLTATRCNNSYFFKLGVIAALTIGAIFVNPIGTDVFLFPYQSIADQTMMLSISEWQAPDAKNTGDLLFYFVPIAMVTMGMLMSDKRFRAVDVLIMLAFLFLFFRSVRFIVLWYIAAVFYAFPYLPAQKIKSITGKVETAMVILLVLALLGVGVHGIVKSVPMCRAGECISQVVDDEIIEIVKEDAPKRLFNDYDLGEALIYHDVPVFIDARADMYAQENVLGQTVALLNMTLNADTSVEEVLFEYGIDAVLLMRSRALYFYINSHPEYYECVYENDVAAYYYVKQYNQIAK